MTQNLSGKIVFASGKTGDYDIWNLDLQSHKMTQLTSGSSWNDKPKWSPDGEWIAFVSHRTGFPEIYKVPAAGGEPIQLTNLSCWTDSPVFSPDGKMIAFVSNEKGNNDLWIMDTDGSNRTQITHHEGSDDYVQWTADGSGLLWSSDRADGNADIWHYDFNRQEQTQLNSDPGADITPAASPDGKLIAFCSNRQFLADPNKPFADRDKDIWLMNSDGTLPVRLTENQGADYAPCWSPDGKQLLYTASTDQNACQLWMLDLSAVVTAYDSELAHLVEEAARDIQTQSVELDRTALKSEIGAQRTTTFLTQFMPENWVASFYPTEFFGLERNPHWVAANSQARLQDETALLQSSSV